MSLIDEINAKSKEVSTDKYSMSIGEIISMYSEGDLDIHPEFQRFYRWTISQKTRLIESFFVKHTCTFNFRFTKGGWCLGCRRWSATPFNHISVCGNLQGCR